MDTKELVKLAIEARKNAYAPYSKYRVGAALLTADGRVFTGCNVENASYPITCCAERTAIFKAVSEGSKDFTAIAVAGGHEDEAEPFSNRAMPCGMCRQAILEFGRDIKVIAAVSENDYKEYKISELIPHGFVLE